jgi:hypothetical protein
MSFLDWPIEVEQISRKAIARRKCLAEELVALFSRQFPQITYTLMWNSQLINAQAWRLGSQRNVYLYGGLARHRSMTRAGLALALAHETGHHLGGEPYDPVMTWMTSEARSDHWAAVSCMPDLFGSKANTLTLRGAREIAALERMVRDDAGPSGDETDVNERLLRFLSSIRRHRQLPLGGTNGSVDQNRWNAHAHRAF